MAHSLTELDKAVTDFIFLGSKITADSNCSNEIQTLIPCKESYDRPRQYIKKKNTLTLPTKVRIVKAMVFPVVMHVCERWTIKMAKD